MGSWSRLLWAVCGLLLVGCASTRGTARRGDLSASVSGRVEVGWPEEMPLESWVPCVGVNDRWDEPGVLFVYAREGGFVLHAGSLETRREVSNTWKDEEGRHGFYTWPVFGTEEESWLGVDYVLPSSGRGQSRWYEEQPGRPWQVVQRGNAVAPVMQPLETSCWERESRTRTEERYQEHLAYVARTLDEAPRELVRKRRAPWYRGAPAETWFLCREWDHWPPPAPDWMYLYRTKEGWELHEQFGRRRIRRTNHWEDESGLHFFYVTKTFESRAGIEVVIRGNGSGVIFWYEDAEDNWRLVEDDGVVKPEMIAKETECLSRVDASLNEQSPQPPPRGIRRPLARGRAATLVGAVNNQVVVFPQAPRQVAYGLDVITGLRRKLHGRRHDVYLAGLHVGYGLLTNASLRGHAAVMGPKLGFGSGWVMGTYSPMFVAGTERARVGDAAALGRRRQLGFRHSIGFGLGPDVLSFEVQHGMTWLGRSDVPRHEIRAGVWLDVIEGVQWVMERR
ncbi:MAG: hypothetical protein AAF799_16840 [Myxococcota bacterium]